MSQTIFAPNSTFSRLIAPLMVVLFLLAVGAAMLSYTYTQQLYTSLTAQNLQSLLQTTRNALASMPTPPQATDAASQARLSALLRHELKLTSLPLTQGLLVLNSNAKVVYHQGPGNVNNLLAEAQSFYRYGDNAIHTHKLSNGEVMVGMHYPGRQVFLAAYSNAPFNTTAMSDRLQAQIWIIFPIGAGFSIILLAWLLHRTLLRPLRKLEMTMASIMQEGRYDQTLTLQGSREMQDLARQFNSMLVKIHERDEALHRQNDTLEELVAARTQELEAAQEQFVRHERLAAIGEFASAIVHELRNPLAAIKMGVDQLSRLNDLDPKNRRRVELSQREVNRLDEMLSGILTFAAVRPTTLTTIDLADLMKQEQENLNTTAQHCGVTLEYHGLDQPRHIMADTTKTLQAIRNIVKNACEAAPVGSYIQVSLAAQPPYAALTVQNPGPPIPEEVQQRVFEPFFTTKKGGTGLGLPTTKKLLAEMDGQLTLVSTADAGTTVTLLLPLKK